MTKSCAESEDKREGEELPAIIHSTLLLSQIRLVIQGPIIDSLYLLLTYPPSHSLGTRWNQGQKVKDFLEGPLKAKSSLRNLTRHRCKKHSIIILKPQFVLHSLTVYSLVQFYFLFFGNFTWVMDLFSSLINRFTFGF